MWSAGGGGGGGASRFGLRTLALSLPLLLPQEDISRLRRKLEKQRKVEVYADADEILQEEIKEYKVREKSGSGIGMPLLKKVIE